MRACKCPNCGANLSFDDDGREYIFCQFCGAKIDLMDQRTIHTERIYDDARVKNADSIHRIVNIFAFPFEDHRRKKAEREAREAQEAEEAREATKAAQAQSRENWEAFEASTVAGLGWCIRFVKTHRSETLSAVAGLAVLIALFTASSHRSALKAAQREEEIAASHIAMGEIFYPSDAHTYGDYRNTYKALKDAGFTNVTAEGAGDLFFGILESENDIIEITVDGAPEFDEDTWYPADTPIVIKYHSFSKKTESTRQDLMNATSQIVQSAVDQVTSSAQSVTQKAQNAINDVASSVQESPSPSQSFPSATKAGLVIHSYEHAYVHTGYASSKHYWLIGTKESIACMINGYDHTAYILTLPSGDFSKGVSIDLGNGNSYSFRSNNLDRSMFITYGNDLPIYFDSASEEDAWKELASVQSYYDLRPVHNIDAVPSAGVRSSQPQSTNTGTSSSSASSSSSVSSENTDLQDSIYNALLDYYNGPAFYAYDLCYVMHAKDYDMYYAICFDDNSVRSFSTIGDLSIQVGTITSGNLEDGMTVHFPYDSGWDEKLKYTSVGSDRKISVTFNGYTAIFTKANIDDMRQVLRSADYYDWIE